MSIDDEMVSPVETLLKRPITRQMANHLIAVVRDGAERTEAAEAMMAIGAIALGEAEGRPAASGRLLRLAFAMLKNDQIDEAVAELARSPQATKQ